MSLESPINQDTSESQQYRGELVEKLKSEKDKGERAEILEKAKETPEYKKAEETHSGLRQEMFDEKDRQKELERDSEYLREIEILKFKFESKITETNRLITDFFNGFSGDISEVDSPESFAEVDEKIKSLDTKIVAGRDYITRASELLLQVRKLESDIKQEIENHNNEKMKIEGRIAELKAEIDALNSKGILSRLMSIKRASELQLGIQDLNKQSVSEEEIIAKHKRNLGTISIRKRFDLEEKMCSLINVEVNKNATVEMGHTLKELWDKINSHPLLLEEIGEAYIDEFIRPVFDRVIEERNKKGSYYGPVIDEKLKDTICSNLKKFIITKDEAIIDELLLTTSNLPSEISYSYQSLIQRSGYNINEPIQGIVSNLFVQYAIEKISAGKETLKVEREKLDRQDKAEGVDNYFRRQIMDDYHMSFPANFDELPYGVKWPISLGRFDRDVLPNMPMWTAGKDLPFVKQVFGEAIESLDQKYFKQILEGSLTDQEGTFIDNLCYYPNPDSIKTLVLLACADFANYRTVHANDAISKLSQRSDWQDLLGATEKVYPELKQIRPILENWKAHVYQGGNSKISGYATGLASSLLEKELSNKKQSKLAGEVLPNNKLITILENRKFPKEETELLKNIDSIVRDNINFHGFARLVRGCIKKVLWFSNTDQNTEELDLLSLAKLKSDNELGAVITISKKIVEVGGDAQAMDFLTSQNVVEKVKSIIYTKNENEVGTEDIDLFLSVYKELPNLSKDDLLLGTFCRYFSGGNTVELYKKLYEKIGDRMNVDMNTVTAVMELVGQNRLSEERALSLWGTIKTLRGEVNFSSMGKVYQELALSRPDLFLITDDGLDFMDHLSRHGSIDNLPSDLESIIGAKFVGNDSAFKREIGYRIVDIELEQKIQPLFTGNNIPNLDMNNWKGLMLSFVGVTEEHYRPGYFFRDYNEQIKNIFAKEGARDICLSEMKKLWLEYLKNGNVKEFPLSLIVLNEYIKNAGGAGPLSQVESLSMFTDACVTMLNNNHTVDRTKREVIEGLVSAESRFVKERWSNEDISDFYNVSKDVVNAAPSLFSEYFNLFENLKPKDFKEFSQEIFPLHRVILSLSEQRDSQGSAKINPRDLVRIRQNVSGIIDENGSLKSVEGQKKELTEQILEMFKNKFGIIKMPEILNLENLRSLSDISMYLANLSGKNAQKEDILGFYLALSINGKWEDYRCGIEVNPGDYLTPEKAERLKPYLESRKKLNPVTSENLNISPEKLPEFMKILQEESESVSIGNVETVDTKLGSVIANLRGLEDLDLYPGAMDKQRMKLLLEYGNKKIGGVVAKLYQSLAGSNKQFAFSDEEAKIKEQIEIIARENGIELNAENIKKYFQDEIKPLAVVANILSFVDELRAEKEISELHGILKPSDEVIAVFNKMGEEFKKTSGAIAISQDLEYLDNLFVKKSGELSEQEKLIVKSYLEKVREKLVSLESIYDLVGKKFASMKQGQNETKNELLRSKLEDISKIINRTESQQVISSAMTNNLPYIIENIRECLSCVRQGGNNDTNLTFGDTNKFYLYSKSEMRAASISDEMVFFEPITLEDGSKEMSFVFDRVYGTNTPTILMNQIEAVYKKYNKIKREFPDTKVSMFITDSAIQTGGLSSELLVEKLQDKFGNKVHFEKTTKTQVNVVESASGDHYVEFGGEARTSGIRSVRGVLIRV